ncbi:MAG: peptidylprolyl isomerase [Gammaproteobacteria bacterium]|nr:peptidylprolyl isomerase [Gammaproteobacteria bacterium]
MPIQQNKVVTLEYTLRDNHGNTIGTTDGQDALSYIHGTNALFPAFEAQLEGRRWGERLQFTLTPEQGYGERDERLMQKVPRERFKGEDIRVGMSFRRGQGEEAVEVIVVAVDEQEVTIDANPPLAGITLNFDVVITGVRDAGSEELESGQVIAIDEIYSHKPPQ